MDIRRVILFIMLVFLQSAGTFAQQPKEIKIGDTVPDLIIKGLINQGIKQVRLRDLYKDKLLLIDFWFTSCVPCIQEIKLLDSLKDLHPSKFNVLMVTYQDSAQIQSFLDRPGNKDVRTSGLILAVKDTLLRKLFPHRVEPHNIWIDRKGVVRAITGTEEVTPANILTFDSSKLQKALKTKTDLLDFKDTEEFHLMDTSFSYRSIITPHIKTGTGGMLSGTSGGLAYNRFFQYNASVAHLYWSAYGVYGKRPLGNFKHNLIEVHTNDSLKFFYPIGQLAHLLKGSKYKTLNEWSADHTFCYALTLPGRVIDTVFRDYMFNDLQRQFNVKAVIENRKVICNVLTRVAESTLPKIAVAAPGTLPRIKFTTANKLDIKNARIDDLLNYIFKNYDSRQITDPFVTDIPNAEDIRFDLELDFSVLKGFESGITPEMYFELLGRYGFRFNKEVRPYPVLVLYDLNK